MPNKEHIPYIHYLVEDVKNNLLTTQDLDENYQGYGSFYAPSFYVPCNQLNNPYPQYVLTTFNWKTKQYREHSVNCVAQLIHLDFLLHGACFKIETKIFKFSGKKDVLTIIPTFFHCN